MSPADGFSGAAGGVPGASGGAPGLGVADVVRVDRSLTAIAQRRLDGTFEVDQWGLDTDLLSVFARLVPPVGVRVTGGGRVPDGPALVLWKGSRLGLAQLLSGLGSATGRPVRFCGVPDVAPVSAVLRRFGGVGGTPSDVRGLLRNGDLVAVRLDTEVGVAEEALAGVGWAGEGSAVTSRSSGAASVDARAADVEARVDPWLPDEAVEAAIHVGAPVVPVVVVSPRPWAPLARVAVGAPVPTRTRRAARSLAEVAAGVASSFAAIGV